MRRIRIALALIVALLCTIVPPMPAQADFALLTLTGNPLTSAAAPYLVLTGLAGQSACALTINTAGGAMAVEGLYKGTTTWTPALTTVSPDGSTTQTTETAVGSYVFNCATMVAVRVDGSAASGTPSVTLNAGGGVNRILGAGVNGGRTIVAGNSPITVTNSGNTATISCTGCGAGPSPTPVSVQAGSGIAVATPSPGVFVISSTVTPSPTSTPVSVQAGSNVTVATPAPGVFVVSASTAAPPNITGAGAVTVATPAANTYVISAPTAAPAPTPVSVIAGNSNVTVATPAPGVFAVSAATAAPPSITSANTNLTVATPAANTYVLTVVTPAPAPTVAITATNLAVTNPSTNVFTLSTIGNYTAPITSPTFGCDSYTLVSAGIYAINGSGYSCSASTSASFVIPAIGSTVSVPVAAGFGIYQKYTPLTISDGTRQIAGLVSATTTATSTSVGFTVERINFGAAGNTVTSGAEIVTGGYDPSAGTGSGTISNITNTDANIVITNPTGPTTTINTSQGPTFTGNTTIGTPGNYGDNGTGLGVLYLSSGGTGGKTQISTYNGGSNTLNGIKGQAIGIGPPVAGSFYWVLDNAGNASNLGSLYSGALSSSAGSCLQATTNGKIVAAPSGCVTTYLNGAQQTGAQAPHIEQWNNAPTIANGAARTYTFATAFLSPPVCQAAQSAAGGGLAPAGLFITAVSTTSVTVNNGTGATQQALLSCIGL